jgi:hypothetical protein
VRYLAAALAGEGDPLGVPRRPLTEDALRAVAVLVAESDPARLDAVLDTVREARLMAFGARSLDAAVMILERHGVEVVLVASGFDGGRAADLARASCCRCMLLVRPDAAASRERGSFERVLAWPFTPEELRAAIGAEKAERA